MIKREQVNDALVNGIDFFKLTVVINNTLNPQITLIYLKGDIDVKELFDVLNVDLPEVEDGKYKLANINIFNSRESMVTYTITKRENYKSRLRYAQGVNSGHRIINCSIKDWVIVCKRIGVEITLPEWWRY